MSKQEEMVALRTDIEQKEGQQYRAEKEMNAWNNSKYKSQSNTAMSKIFVQSLRKEISELHKKLRELENE